MTSRRMGALPPRYSFALNPYMEVRFTTCPECKAKTRLRKLPLAIHTEGFGLFVRKTCRMCVACDMVIVHQDELEPLIAARLRHQDKRSRHLEYLVLGTVEPQTWRNGLDGGGVSFDELVLHMADFSRYMQIEQTGHGWGPTR